MKKSGNAYNYKQGNHTATKSLRDTQRLFAPLSEGFIHYVVFSRLRVSLLRTYISGRFKRTDQFKFSVLLLGVGPCFTLNAIARSPKLFAKENKRAPISFQLN